MIVRCGSWLAAGHLEWPTSFNPMPVARLRTRRIAQNCREHAHPGCCAPLAYFESAS